MMIEQVKVALLERALAESQARAQKLRTALAAAIKEADGWHDECRGEPCEGVDWCRDVLSMPSDGSALREMIEASASDERELCAMVCEYFMDRHGDADATECAEAIRLNFTST